MSVARPKGAPAKSKRGKPPRRVVVSGDHAVKGRLVITDPELRRKLNPPMSKETVRRIEELERASADAMYRMRSIRVD